MIRRHLLGGVGGLTAAALLSSGSTYVLFVLFARHASAADLGRFVAVSGLVLLATQILDGGSGLIMVRDVAQAHDSEVAATLMASTFRRRLSGLALVLPTVLLAGRVVFELDSAALVATAAYLLGSVGYGFAVQVMQAQQRFSTLMTYQGLNAGLFTLLGVAAFTTDITLDLWMMLSVSAVAVLLLAVGAAPMLRRDLAGGSRKAARTRELWMVRAGSIGAAVAANVDTLLLGAISPRVTATYAGAQRAALGLSALSSALMSVLLPKVSGADGDQHRALVRAAMWLAAPIAVGGLLLGAALTAPLAWLYGDSDLVPLPVLALLIAAYALGALSSAPISVLYALRRGDLVAVLTIGQAVIVLCGCVVAALNESAVGVATVIAAGKSLYLATALMTARRALAGQLPSGAPGSPAVLT